MSNIKTKLNKQQEKAINELNQGYNEYKKNHPDFAKVVERDSESKTDEEFEKMFKDNG